MQGHKVAAVVALSALVAGSVAACTNSGGSGNSSDSSSTVVSVGIGEPKSLIPPNAGETEGGQVVYSIFAPVMVGVVAPI